MSDSALRRLATALCASVGTALYGFTWNSVGVALPHMQGAFSATTDQITWVMIAFIIGAAMATASVGWFSVRFGRKRLFLAAIAGYSVTLFGCGLSTSLEEEVLWRFLQGVAGAALIPLGQAIAVNAFPPERHGQATSIWAIGFVASNLMAPAIAGVIIEHYGWPWIFYMTVPFGVAVFIASCFLVPKTPTRRQPLDWFGLSTLIVGVSSLQLMLARGERLDWFDSTEIIIEAVVAVTALYLTIAHSLTAKRPFLDRALFRNSNFVLGQFFIFMIGAVLYLPLLLLPLLLQQIGGYPAIETGHIMLSRGVGSIMGLLIMTQLRDRMDPRPIMLGGLLVTCFSAWLMAHWTTEIRPMDVMWANFLQGIATSAIWAPLNLLALKGLDKRVQDQGFALFYLNFDIGSAIGTAALVGLHARHSQINHAVLNEAINPFNDLFRYRAVDEIWSLGGSSELAAIELEVTRQATMIAYNNAFLAMALVLAAMIPFIIFFRHRGARQLQRG